MRLVESGDPGEVPRAEARRLLCERLALAAAVCHALQDDSGQLVSETSRAPLDMLRQWVREHYPTAGPETLVDDGLEQMRVPEGDEALYQRLSAATYVCEGLARLYTADTQAEFGEDSWKLEAEIERWHRRSNDLLPPVNRPFRTKLQVLALDYAHGFAEIDDVVYQLMYGLPYTDDPPWLPGMDEWTGIAYLQAAGILTEEQVTPLRQAYDAALLALLDEEGRTDTPGD